MGLPKTSQGAGSGLNAESLATAMVLAKQVGGSSGPTPSFAPGEILNLQQQIASLKNDINNLDNTQPTRGKNDVRYLDQKTI